MKILFILLLLALTQSVFAQATETSPRCIFIITSDGLRWQEIFNGPDSSILGDRGFVQDPETLKHQYWAPSAEERRKKLMPFLWNYISAKGQIWGNRDYENKVSVANPYRFSYAGYNELLTGYADPALITNKPRNNGNSNLLGYLNTTEGYRGKIALFGSWKLFSFIVNGSRNRIPLNCGYQSVVEDSFTTITEQAVNYLQQNSEFNTRSTRSDLLTFSLASEYIRKNHPRIIYIGFGETDEFAHHGQYDNYLNQVNMFDKLLAEFWSQVQQDPFYKNNTAFFVTTDHGRGAKTANWPKHGPFVKGSDETWLVQWGPGISALGEVKMKSVLTTEQFAQTIAGYLGEYFTAEHPVADPAWSLLPVKASGLISNK